MTKAVIFFLLIIFAFPNSAWTQNHKNYPVGRMEYRADSVSRITDSLISSKVLFHLTFESKYEGDTTTYYRHYYIDTLKLYLLKCIIDTTFDDHYKRTFKQVVVYFNQGYEFRNCINERRGVNSGLCSYSNIYPEEGEIKQQTGALTEIWTKEALDQKIRHFVGSDIYMMKFMQKRNHD